MILLKCPKPEALLEYISITRELSVGTRVFLRCHLLSCQSCREKTASIENNWKQFFMAETDITLSLMRVFSRLKKDETLILKGWKLDQSLSRREFPLQNWIFRGAISLGVFALALGTLPSLLRKNELATGKLQKLPIAQFRFEERNGVRVHYVRPELLESIEFRTTSGGR